MSWSDLHSRCELLAGEAELAFRHGDFAQAEDLYSQAAELEEKALDYIDKSKQRTIGISSISATALWYKSGKYARAQQLAYRCLSTGLLPEFANEELKSLLQTIWNEEVRKKTGLNFSPGQVIVSVKGGEVVRGGAPLDLIVEKVQIVQSIFYRVVEFLKKVPHRHRGIPSQEIRDICRPWIFQSTPGSYQFAVGVEEPQQYELFPTGEPKSTEVADQFLKIIRAGVEDPENELQFIVPDSNYRSTFLKLTRNLAPSGKSFNTMELKSSEDSKPIILIPNSRKAIGEVLRRQVQSKQFQEEITEEILSGILRALHLDKDWLEVTVENKHIHIEKVGDIVDDVIGPMVNRPVNIVVSRDSKGRYLFRDIEPAE